jgi:hypothetical protein
MKLMGEWNWYLPEWIARILRVSGEGPPGTRAAPEV